MGWCMEIVWTGLGSLIEKDLRLIGYTNIWMFFVYGSAVLLEPLHEIIKNWKLPFRGMIWVIIIWGIEYTSGLSFKRILGVQPWLYFGPFSVDGLIRLDFAPVWFIAGIIFERIHIALDNTGIL